jgi:cell division transport system permease protein
VAAVIRHALIEGWFLLGQRAVVSLILALSLAVPICLAGVTLAVGRWLEPVGVLSEEESVVAVLMHPHLDHQGRQQWLEEQAAKNPHWKIQTVPPEQLAKRLGRWFPYLEDLLEDQNGGFLPPLVEIATTDIASIDRLQTSPAVIAIGPRTSLRRVVGRSARKLGWVLGLLSVVLLGSAAALAAIWVHLEIYRHGDEITIMRLIGATEWAIRGPFLVAVVVPGLCASVLSALGTVSVTRVLSGLVVTIGLPELELAPWILTLQAITGFFLPLGAGLITLARHAYLELEAS